MLGIVLATHGTFSEGLKNSVDVIIGNTEGISTCVLEKGQGIEDLGKSITTAIEEVNEGDGVVILVDLESASPYNQSLMSINGLDEALKNNTYVITGVNLPMLIEAVNHRFIGTPIKEAVPLIKEQGLSGIAQWHISDVANTQTDDFDDDF